jgi:chemosensory pili system protein ChpA (sensor histidine kinase/response regulator)
MIAAEPSVLVVDDDEDIRDVLSVLLETEGFHVDTARDGVEALEQLKSGPPPAVVLLDMMMPRMDGESLVREMKRDPAVADVPVVIMSGHSAVREKAESLAAADCLVKPVEVDELLRVVRRFTTAA